MNLRTYGDIKIQLEQELSLEAEDFIQASELQGLVNTGVSICEAQIVKLGLREKYFQAESFISLIQGQSDYALPTDCIETKLRKVIYRNNTNIFTLEPLRGEDAYVTEDILSSGGSKLPYGYMIYKINGVYKLRVVGAPQTSITNGLRLIYFKDVNRYTGDDSVICDLPSVCYEFLMSYVRYRVYAKEPGHPSIGLEKEDMGTLSQLMVDTLTNQVADPDMDKIDADTSYFEEMN